jgi:glucan phosphoethanolaminetransferase (alkaline phosphatase superfamily)
MEADTYDFIKEDSVSSTYNPSDDELLKLVEEELAKGATKQFIVLHTYGSHFNYRERYRKMLSLRPIIRWKQRENTGITW